MITGPGTRIDGDGGLTGYDADDLVQLNGTFSTIKWTDPIVGCEGFGDHGFTVGIGRHRGRPGRPPTGRALR